MSTYRVFGICGSLRTGSFNMGLLEAAGQLMPAGMTLSSSTTLIDLPLYNPDVEARGFPDSVLRLRDQVLQADAILFAATEYNWTISASLKNGIDWLSRFKENPTPFEDKPCALLSATTGPLGGARVQYDLRRSIGSLGAHILMKPEVFVGMAAQKFDETGALTDETTKAFVEAQMIKFKDWIQRVKALAALS